MKKKSEFVQYITEIVNGSKEVFKNDKPAIRQLFNDTLDGMARDCAVTEAQASNWYLTATELNKILKGIK